MKTIVQTGIDAGIFNTLITAVQTAGLVEVLSEKGPFTVFAPTDDAFAKLPEGTVNDLLGNKDDLKKILTYHVVSGKVMAKDIVSLDFLKTLQGEDVVINTTDGVMVNDAKVTKADIECSNGVIHVIDTVLMPK